MTKKFKHIVYLALDELKLYSGDSDYTEEHIIFIASKLRAYLLEKKYQEARYEMSEENLQEICFDLENVDIINGVPCSGSVVKSIQKIPSTLKIYSPRIYPTSALLAAPFTMVPMHRLAFVGNNKWTANMIYVAIGPDMHIYIKSANPQIDHLKKVRMSAVFTDVEEVAKLCCESCNTDGGNCDIMEMDFPLEDSLVTLLIQSIVQELSGIRYQPKDSVNNSADDMTKFSTARNPKDDSAD